MNTRTYSPFTYLFFLLFLAATVLADVNWTVPAPAGIVKILTSSAYVYRGDKRLKAEKNIRISRARAHIAAKTSGNHGIDPNRFPIQAKGKTELRILTSDNTPEPGNRRVEVAIRQP